MSGTSAGNAWAVGAHSFGPTANYSAKFEPLIEHWDGTAWKVVPSRAVHGSVLVAVSAASAGAAWAVGSGYGAHGLIEHWNGKVWKLQRTTPRSSFSGVAATSATNAWAVGSDSAGTLILHWNGKTWTAQPSPNPEPTPQPNQLVAVSASSPTNAWAVGATGNRGRKHPPQTLIAHWNGKSWKAQRSPNPRFPLSGDGLGGVAAVSANQAWAVGAAVPRKLIFYWNGTTWKR